MISAFSEQIKSILLKVSNQVTSLDRHSEPVTVTLIKSRLDSQRDTSHIHLTATDPTIVQLG